jgi:hypothetical protein
MLRYKKSASARAYVNSEPCPVHSLGDACGPRCGGPLDGSPGGTGCRGDVHTRRHTHHASAPRHAYSCQEAIRCRRLEGPRWNVQLHPDRGDGRGYDARCKVGADGGSSGIQLTYGPLDGSTRRRQFVNPDKRLSKEHRWKNQDDYQHGAQFLEVGNETNTTTSPPLSSRILVVFPFFCQDSSWHPQVGAALCSALTESDVIQQSVRSKTEKWRHTARDGGMQLEHLPRQG